jgi:hypothetical protein
VCGTWVQAFEDNGKLHTWRYPTQSEEVKIALMFYSPLAHPSVVIRKTLFDNYSYTEEFNKAEDYYLWYQVKNSFKLANLPEVLLKYRLHAEQMGSIYDNTQLKLSNRIRLKGLNDFGIIPTKKEIEIHEAISRYQKVNFNEAEYWLEKLYNQNIENHLFEHIAFENFISKKWWQNVNSNTNQGIKLFFCYFKSKNRKFRKQNKLQILKLFIKCLIKHEA